MPEREIDRTATGVRHLIKTKRDIADVLKNTFLHSNHQKKCVEFLKAIVVPYQNWVFVACDRAI